MSLEIQLSSKKFFRTPYRMFQNNHAQLWDLYPIFTKPKATRTPQETDLALAFLKTLHFFSSMDRDLLESEKLLTEFLGVMECATYNQGETIFNYQDRPSKFYIILKGSVDIHVPKTEEEQKNDHLKLKDLIMSRIQGIQKNPKNQEREAKIRRRSSEIRASEQKIVQLEQLLAQYDLNFDITQLDGLISLLSHNDQLQINPEKLLSKYKKLTTLDPGSYFGELAISANCSRSAKAVAATDLCVATLSKNDYSKILHKFETAFRDKMDFFTNLIGVGSDERPNIAKFCYGFKERKYTYGQKIFRQGEMPQEVFIVKEGEVQISTQDAPEKHYYLGPLSIPKKRQSCVEKLANSGVYTILGENESMSLMPYTTTVTACSNDTILYVISVKEFQNLKTFYKPIFEKIIAKSKIQTAYLRDRSESVSNVGKKELSNFSDYVQAFHNTSRGLTNQEVSQIHGIDFYKNKIKKISMPNIQGKPEKETRRKNNNCFSAIISQNKNNGIPSPISIFAELSPRYSSSQRTLSKATPKSKVSSTCTSNEPTPKNTHREKSTFGEYFTNSTDLAHQEIEKTDPSPSYLNKRLEYFAQALQKKKLKDSRSGSVGLLVTSQNFKIRKSLPLDKNTSSSYEINVPTSKFQSTRKSQNLRCSIINHLT